MPTRFLSAPGQWGHSCAPDAIRVPAGTAFLYRLDTAERGGRQQGDQLNSQNGDTRFVHFDRPMPDRIAAAADRTRSEPEALEGQARRLIS